MLPETARSSARTRVFELTAMVLVLVQGLALVLAPRGMEVPPTVGVLGIVLAALSLGMSLWVAWHVKGACGGLRWAVTWIVLGAAVRLWVLPFPWYGASGSLAQEPTAARYALIAIAYAAAMWGYFDIARSESGNRLSRQPLWWAAGAGTSVAIVLTVAGTAPLPRASGMWNSVSAFAATLLWLDAIVLALTIYIACVNLQVPGSETVRAWIWITAGHLALVMGDVLWPLVGFSEATRVAALLWGSGYCLAATGASIKLDVLDRRESVARDSVLREPLTGD